MKIDEAPEFRILTVNPKEYFTIRCAIGALVDLCEENPELFAGHPRILSLVDVARDMYDKLKGTNGVLEHVQVQDKTVRAPD
jgi:hypothetical protein